MCLHHIITKIVMEQYQCPKKGAVSPSTRTSSGFFLLLADSIFENFLLALLAESSSYSTMGAINSSERGSFPASPSSYSSTNNGFSES